MDQEGVPGNEFVAEAVDFTSVTDENEGLATKRKIPPALKVDHVEAVGEKSPAPVSVYDLFKKYQKSETKAEDAGQDMNVGFDQLSSDEKSGFLRKLQMLTVGNKKSPKNVGDSTPSPAGRLLKKFIPTRRTNEKQSEYGDSPSRFNMFGKNSKNVQDTERPTNPPRKKSARRLNFGKETEKKPESERQNNKVVAAMTREYEKIVVQKAVPVSINRPIRSHCSRGSLETPTDSPAKVGSNSTTSSPTSAIYNTDQTSREQYTNTYEDSPNKKRTGSRQGFSNRDNNNASWHGELPPRDYTSPTFSRKIFVGGVPWDITEAALKDSFGEFGACAVEWPGQEARYRSGQTNGSALNTNLRSQSKYVGQAATGYVYMIFEDERAVASLLHECSQEIGGAGEWYFKIRAQRSKSTEIRQVQIIPWVTSDSMFCEDETLLETGIEPKRTVFVGALHGMMTAQVLHSIMEDCFGTVECVQLDTDKFKYPIGSGRVTFLEHGAYFKAIEIGYLHVHTSKFRKRVQIDPFLESTCCMVCTTEPAHCFCRNRNCFKYYCHSCWAIDHGKDNDTDVHVPVIVPSSATKAYPGQSRRLHLSSNSPSKISCLSSSQNSQMAHVISPAFPMIVGSPAQTLSALYGYIQNNQQMMISPAVYEAPITPSPSETTLKRRSFTEFQTPSTIFFNSTPVMTPQKAVSSPEGPVPFYTNSTAFLTPPPTYYSSPSHSSPSNVSQQQQPYYGPNVYYGYMPQPMAYDAPSNGSTQMSMCIPPNLNYQ
uniref:Cytoplasmic polyadenylation element-binding protein 3 n=1 Tax=Caenorhabditis brenneri TaxID=135651 RepID=Q6E3D3_CAEBE|nr:CPB-3 [Caenorhabditis brenneri]AAT72445.1 CPB-3 [Caenorhabditis brenneri]